MNNEVSIVTFFFDTGRGEWTPDKGFPHYLHRTVDTYFERFSYMAQLDNEMIIYTTPDLVEKVWEYRKDKFEKTVVVEIDYHNMFAEERMNIAKIQMDDNYRKKIHPSQKMNPEYWSADYVLVNFLKSYFVNRAIESGIVNNEQVAWIDFGYCRNMEMLGGHTEWNYEFTPGKIHMFEQKKFETWRTIEEVIATNDVHILGAKIVATKDIWPTFEKLINHSINELFKNNLVDDDQTVMLMSYLMKPEFFELHCIAKDHTWIDKNSIFKEYNV